MVNHHYFKKVFGCFVWSFIFWTGSLLAQAPQDTTSPVTTPSPKTFALSTALDMRLSGYVQFRYTYFTEENRYSTFDIRRARLSLQGNILDPKIGYKLQVDFAGNPKILDATAAYTAHPYFKITIGEFKIPFSNENLTSSAQLISINRSQVVEALVARSRDVIGQQNGRDIGAQVSGVVKGNKEFALIDYSFGIFNGAGINTLADNNQAKDFSGRVVLQPIKGLTFGSSYYNGTGTWGVIDTSGVSIIANRNRDRIGGEVSFVRPRYALSGEYIRGEDDTTQKEGFFVQLSGYAIQDRLQLLVKYDWYDPNADIPENALTHYIFGINYYLNKNARIQAHYQAAQEEGGDETKLDNDIVAIMAQLQF